MFAFPNQIFGGVITQVIKGKDGKEKDGGKKGKGDWGKSGKGDWSKRGKGWGCKGWGKETEAKEQSQEILKGKREGKGKGKKGMSKFD